MINLTKKISYIQSNTFISIICLFNSKNMSVTLAVSVNSCFSSVSPMLLTYSQISSIAETLTS